MKTFLFLAFLLALSSPGYAAAAGQVSCKLEPQNDHWISRCGRLYGKRLSIDIRAGDAIASGAWRSDIEPSEVWAGTMDHGKSGTWPLEIERYGTGMAFARTMFGWLEVSGWTQAEDEIVFKMNPGQRVAPSKLDYRIVHRAGELLVNEAVWDREDDRKCKKGAEKLSIYCALVTASHEIAGGHHHRRPALEVVRKIVRERSKSRDYEHALMDYNNDRRTRLEDVHSLFSEAGEVIIESLGSGAEQ